MTDDKIAACALLEKGSHTTIPRDIDRQGIAADLESLLDLVKLPLGLACIA